MAAHQLLDGRAAIVTGAASGMGRVMARALAAAGSRVAALDIDTAGLDRLAAEPVFAGKFLAIAADVSKAADCRGAVRRAVETFGALDILINCAGVSMSTAAGDKEARIKFFDADAEGWQRILAINCIGAFLMARFAAEPMIKRGWGRIINVTTSFDTMLAAGLSAYGASKAGLEAMSVAWSKDLEGTGVTVNVLVPGGPTDTPGFFPPGKPRPAALLDPEGRAGRVARVSAIGRDQRMPLHRARLGPRPPAGGSGRARAHAGRVADPGTGRGGGPRACDVAGARRRSYRSAGRRAERGANGG
jgi:NAD(P)-dependent dehydrogenase (short-subunit alcohol dehydrogenase family)